MPKLLGVKANLSFGQFRAGKVYEIDLEDGRMLSLLGVGYLSPVDEQEDEHGQVDAGRGVRRASAVRVLPVVGSPGSLEEVNVDDQAEPASGPGKRKGAGVRSRKAADSSGASGGEGAGPRGLASARLGEAGGGADVEGVLAQPSDSA